MATTRTALAVGLLLVTARLGLTKCDPSFEPDLSDVAAARAAVAASCDCGTAANHGAYVKCAGQQAGLVLQNKGCLSVVKKCAARSTCGKPGFVTCCRTTSKGKTTCSTKSSVAKCTPPKGGTACVGSFSSCCDACTASGCAAPDTSTSTTTSTSTSTTSSTSTTTSTTMGSVSFSADVQPIFTGKCAFPGCHGGASPAAGMNLASGQAYASIVSVASTECPTFARIAPGAPGASYLLFKVQGTGPCFVGSMMPLVGSPLSAAEIQTIGDWVTQGAANN